MTRTRHLSRAGAMINAMRAAPIALGAILAMSTNAWAGNLPSTGQGTPPSATVSTDVGTVVSWACWTAFTIAILGVIFVAFRMIIQHHRGEGGQHFAGLLYVLGGAILVAAASGIVGAIS